MKGLDDIITKLDSLYIPISVKGKVYPGNNPYILNEINNMLEAGWIKKRYGGLTEQIKTLEPEDLKWDDNRLHFEDSHRGYKYLFFDELEQINIDICNEEKNLDMENRERLAAEKDKETPK
jgi:hypothetical protein